MSPQEKTIGLDFQLATAKDDPEIRQLLRHNPMEGSISVAFTREPNYFLSAQLEGERHQTLVVRDPKKDHQIVSIASRVVRKRFINGRPQEVAYFSQMRIMPNYRISRHALAKAWQFLHQLHLDDPVPFYFSTIIADNLPAQRLLTRGLPGMPQFNFLTPFHTFAIHCRWPKRSLPLPPNLTLRPATAKDTKPILDLLHQYNQQRQLAPVWNADNLFNPLTTPNLTPHNFILAERNKQLVGSLALWDQSAVKQTVIDHYSGSIGRWRPLLNLLSRLFRWPTLPNPNQQLHFAFASHLAILDDDPQIFNLLLRTLYNQAVQQKFHYVTLGLPHNHPFIPLTTQYPHIPYPSNIYSVDWATHPTSELNQTLSFNPEISIL